MPTHFVWEVRQVAANSLESVQNFPIFKDIRARLRCLRFGDMPHCDINVVDRLRGNERVDFAVGVACMKHSSLEISSEGAALSSAMRAIRRRRGLTASEVAQSMALPLRTFEEFEAGRGPLTQDRIFAFADATDSDPFALLLCGALNTPDLALDSADTKFVMIMMMHLEEFVERHGSDISFLEPPNIIGAFERVFKDLGARLEDREQFIQKWLEQRTGSIGLSALRRRGVKRASGRDKP